MRALHVFLTICLASLMVQVSLGQFFTKTTNSIPRMGRSDKMLPNLVRRVARTLHFVVKMVEDYDQDGNGELNPEELMDIPFLQNAVKSYIEARELRGQYLVTSTRQDKYTSEPSGKQRMMQEEPFIM